MNRKIMAIVAATLLFLSANALFAQPAVSQKKEIAIFGLGYYGWNIPKETLGTIDIDIQRVFIDLGRFTIFGMEKRFSSADVGAFIDVLKKTKEANFVLPEKYQFGEAFLTEAEFQKLIGAFIIAMPVVTSYNSQFVDNKEWKTDIKTNISFINVEDGVLIGIANVETSGTSKETQYKSIQSAINGIPTQLQFEIRKIPAFQLATRVLASSIGTVDIQLGSDMGIKKGDEYSVIVSDTLEGITDEREVGLLMIKEVGNARSKAITLFSSIPVVKDVQLREIPRLGINFDVYANYNLYLFGDNDNNSAFVVGFRGEGVRGFYNLKPYVAMQMVLDASKWLPLNVIAGGQYAMYLRRLEIGGRIGVAGGSNIILKIIEGEFNSSDDEWFTHYGLSAGAYMGWLFNRNFKVFANLQADGMFGLIPNGGSVLGSYGGIQVGIGATLKQ